MGEQMKIIKILLAVLLLCAAFIGGIFFEYTAERQEIADIEQMALESCNLRINAIKKLCK